MKQLTEAKISRILIIFIIYTLLFFLVVSTIKYTLPFFLAFFIASLLKYPAVFLIRKYNINISLVSIILTLLFGSLAIGFLYLILSTSITELFHLSKYLQSLLNKNYSSINDLFNRFNTLTDELNITPILLSSIQNGLKNMIRNITTDIISIGSLAVKYFLSFIKNIPYIIMVIIFTLMSTYFILKYLCLGNTMQSSANKLGISISDSLLLRIINISSTAKILLRKSLLSYLILVLTSFIITFLGLTLFKVPYSLLLSFLCIIFDILPILGMPLIYFPLIFYYLLNGNVFTGIGILMLFLLVFISRQILEPKIMSTTLNVSPFLMLCSIFIGLEAGGIIGMIYLMILAILFSTIKDSL